MCATSHGSRSSHCASRAAQLPGCRMTSANRCVSPKVRLTQRIHRPSRRSSLMAYSARAGFASRVKTCTSVAGRGEAAGLEVGVDFGAAARQRRKTVHDDQDAHGSDTPRAPLEVPRGGSPSPDILPDGPGDRQGGAAQVRPERRVRLRELAPVQHQRAADGVGKSTDRRHRAQAEQPMQLLMQHPGAFQLVPGRSVVRVLDDGVGDVREAMTGEERLPSPLEVFGDRRRPKWNCGPHGLAESPRRRCR